MRHVNHGGSVISDYTTLQFGIHVQWVKSKM